MRLATVVQSREIDSLSHSVYGLSAEVLMESAGALAAREVEQAYFPELARGQVVVLCGPGHNGGDGLVLARHLFSSRWRNLVVLLLDREQVRSPLVREQIRRCELQGIRILDLGQNKSLLETASLIVDALFGIGLDRPLEGLASQAVAAVNLSSCPVVSLDCPSGLDSDSGNILGSAVRASMTLSFGLAKPGFFVNQGPRAVGRLRVLTIGFPPEVLRTVATSHFLFTEKLARRYLPRRKDQSHKSNHGHLLVIAGSQGFWGAGVLASSAGFRMGAGYVTWASHSSPNEQLKDCPEVLTGSVADEALWSRKISSAVIGPGLGGGQVAAGSKMNQEIAGILERLRGLKIPVVVDADAYSVCIQEGLLPLPANWVVTPHAGEASRLLGVSAQEVELRRFESALALTEQTGCPVLLKGFRSLVAFSGKFLVIHSGNSALAKAGTGDILAGMIGGLMAQGLESVQAAATGAFVHGRISDEWVKSGRGAESLLASDLQKVLPSFLGQIRRAP